ncbi:HTH-type transcriptional activator RhaS (L-rhamnose operon regulatoryprotein rhaS) [Clostridium sp. D5]|nr:HTH-type transcriptional activator RhaS (L-rhamnose operon regulatoryprotein rhaS) [Clostridium sp. D5]
MELKLTEARHLLDETNLTLNDIAYKLGFSNGNYFSKVFKRNVGRSPREYRNKNLS